MRFLPLFVLVTLPALAVAQPIAEVQKAASAAPDSSVSAEVLGQPVAPADVKTATLVAAKASEAMLSDFDTDKVAGNDPVDAPLAMRLKAASALPAPPPDAAALGQGPAGQKAEVLAVSLQGLVRPTSYDSDKIDGNPEVTPPLMPRSKATGQVPDGATAADFGQPAAAPTPKVADLAVSHAAAVATIYDDDKITGNEPPPAPLTDRQKAPSVVTASLSDSDLGILDNLPLFKSADLAVSHAMAVPSAYDDDKDPTNNPPVSDDFLGPLAERQKFPSELPPDADSASFGQPAVDAPKTEFAISKAEGAVPSVEDNDKIVGNPYVTPPLAPRQKAAVVLADPLVDPDMGQPAVDAPKTDLAISKAATDQQSLEDYDKIVGNPVVAPPLAERSKQPAYEAAALDLTPADLGLPADGNAAKTLTPFEVSKLALAVTTTYDDDKIAENNDRDVFDDGTDSFDFGPDPAVVATIRALLDDPATRSATLDGVSSRGLAPAAIAVPFQSLVALLYDTPEVADALAVEIASVAAGFGVTPDDPLIVGRMAAEFMAGYGDREAALGMARLPVAEQRGYLADLARVATDLPPYQCGPYLGRVMEPLRARQVMLSAMANWPQADVEAAFIRLAGAAIAHLQDTPPLVPLPPEAMSRAQLGLGTAAFAAIDAADNATALLSAYGAPEMANPVDLCAVHQLILKAALAETGPAADEMVRYLVEFGWIN